MKEEFILWQHPDISRSVVIEALKGTFHNFACEMRNVGVIEADINNVSLNSNTIPILPVRVLGDLDRVRRKPYGFLPRAVVHIVSWKYDNSDDKQAGVRFGYATSETDELQVDNGAIVLNGQRKFSYRGERNLLKPVSEKAERKYVLTYHGVTGTLKDVALRPKNPGEYPFVSICFRDYLRM